jgi:molybdenum cofactor cytidylyltransferase
MGVPKQSLQFQGSTLLLRAVDTAMASVCRPIVVVLGAGAEEFEKALRGKPVEVVVNPDWSAGMGTSIRAGVSAIRSGAIDAVMIFLCDQPLIPPSMLDQMVSMHFSKPAPITAAFYADTFGTPVIFAASLFDELLELEDQQGGKTVLARHPNQVTGFHLPEAEVDVDTMDDFNRLTKLGVFDKRVGMQRL